MSHSKGEIVGAFKAAAVILEEVTQLGFESPHFEIYADGSCVLRVCREESSVHFNKHATTIINMMYSNRFVHEHGWLGIRSCEGLFQYANDNPRPME